jgi:predicted ester cyclase
MTDAALAAARDKTVRDHMRLEITHEWDAVIGTFDHPRYELIGTGNVFDGEAAVRAYFRASRIPFPDQSNEVIHLRQCEDAIVVEFWLTGTHLGPLKTPAGEAAPTGKTFRAQVCAVFEFAPGTDRIVCERVYFDQGTILRQLGVG